MNNPSRERFELGPWPSKYTADDSVFYNTTSETGPQLAEYQQKAGEQNETVLAIFHKANKPLSPSQVLEWWRSVPSGWGKPLPPLTSIRRAMTVLTQAGALVKTETKRKGIYNRAEFVWRLPEAGDTASQSPSGC